MIDKIEKKIIDQLKKELPEKFKGDIDIIIELINLEEYRKAFIIMNSLRESGEWCPSELLNSYYETFWWDMAN